MTARSWGDIIGDMTAEQHDTDRALEFDTIAIVSLGLIGSSLALAFKRVGFTGKLIGVSRRETLDSALDQGVIDEGDTYDNLATVAEQADAVFLAGPIQIIRRHLEILGAASTTLSHGTIISDVGSTKKTILDDAERLLPEGIHFIGGHPMAGSEKRGLDAADPFLFQNAYYALTPARSVPPEVVDGFGKFLSRTGARVVKLRQNLAR